MNPASQCPLCGAKIPDSMFLCSKCRHQIGHDLATIGEFYEPLYLVASKQANLSVAGSGHSTKASAPLPLNSDGYELASHISTFANQLLRALNQLQFAVTEASDAMSRLFLQLSFASERLANGLKGIEYAREARGIVTTMDKYLAREDDRKYVCDCPVCATPVYAADDEEYRTCLTCGNEIYLATERMEQVKKLDLPLNLRAQDASDLLAYKGITVKASKIRQWASRGRLVKVTDDDKGHPLYYINDILALAAQQ